MSSGMYMNVSHESQKRFARLYAYQRYIYIHGAPDDVDLGEPGSAGCVRMRNNDVIELFALVAEGCPVELV